MKNAHTPLVSLLLLGALLAGPSAMQALQAQKKTTPPPAKPQPQTTRKAPVKPAPSLSSNRPGAVRRPDGTTVRTGPDGRVSDVHIPGRGLDIHNGIAGGRKVRLDRPDHSGIFYDRGRPGYVQRPYSFRGHDFARRTYVYNGHVYSRFYHGYSYRGAYINVYAPERFYHPAFYGWAYHPWAHPVDYRWGFVGTPWYGYYGGYFAPAPIYTSPSLWLTDYILAQNLQAAYAAQTQQDGAPAGPMPDGAAAPPAMPPAGADVGASSLTPEIKQQIANEVQSQIALENQEAQQNAAQQEINPGSSGIDRILNDGHTHTLVVSSAIDAEDTGENGCTLSEGDVLSLRPPTPPDAETAKLVVLSSKGGRECRPNTTITVVLADLQEMQNHMRENIDQGFTKLQAEQGKNGIPSVPQAAQGAPTQASYAAIAPPEDPDAATQIQQQAQQADQTEQSTSPGAQ
jgi:hypothetical protein